MSPKRPPPGLILHADRSGQYCAHDDRRLLRQFTLKASMSRTGNRNDNAPIERCWGKLKNEMAHQRRYEGRAQAWSEIAEYIAGFYNRQRRHSKLGNRAPAVFAKQNSKRAAAWR